MAKDLAAEGRNWTAKMIAPDCDEGAGTRGSFVCSEFDVEEGAKPVLYVSAQGLYRAFVNGKRVGEDHLTPGWTCYDDRIAYQSYDLSDLVQPGTNRIEIWLADGWYRSALMWRDLKIENTWGDRIAAIAEIEIDGKVICGTDVSWKSGLTPVTKSGIYFGEDHDARLQDVTADSGVTELAFDHALLVPQETGTVRALEAISPVGDWTDQSGHRIYDFGQNVGGFVRLTMQGKSGAVVRIAHAEVLGPDREFDNRNYRSARAEAVYTLSGEGQEVWEPAFTFMGFRFARVEITGEAELVDIQSIPVSSVPDLAGGITTSEPLVDRLVQNTIWSQRANFIEVPTDCPQRDERLGWSGDAQVFAGTACWLADSESFLKKYLRDLMHDQRPNGAIPHFAPDPTLRNPNVEAMRMGGSTGWGDAITVIPWQIYLHYGDEGVLRECWPAILKWLDYLWDISGGPIIRPSSSWGGRGFTFGDWLQPVGDNRKPRPTIGDDCAATFYHYISNDLAAKIGRIIGETGEADARAQRAEEIRAAFAHEYVSASGRLAHNDQTSYALAFLFGLVPDEHVAAAKGYFRTVIEDADYIIGTGFIGTPALLPALSKLGMNDLAEKVFLNRKVPGWLYQVEQGATSIWERWDSIAPDGTIYEPDMNSYNHYAYGAVCQWLFEQVAGVSPTADDPGFDLVNIDPQVLPALGPVDMWHECRHGRIEARWALNGSRVTYDLTLPEGCTGRLLPSVLRGAVTVNGTQTDIPAAGMSLPSGKHSITFDHVS